MQKDRFEARNNSLVTDEDTIKKIKFKQVTAQDYIIFNKEQLQYIIFNKPVKLDNPIKMSKDKNRKFTMTNKHTKISLTSLVSRGMPQGLDPTEGANSFCLEDILILYFDTAKTEVGTPRISGSVNSVSPGTKQEDYI